MSASESTGDKRPGGVTLEEIEAMTGVSFAHVISKMRGAEPSTVWISGSLVEGLGHANSDIDMFIVVENLDDSIAPTRRDEDVYVKVDFAGSRRIDFEYWPTQRIAALADKLAGAPIGHESENILDYFREHEIEFMHRLHFGIPLIGEEAFKRLRETFDHRRLRQYLIENKRLYIDDTFDDAVGLLEEGHLSSAVFRARYAVEASVDMLLYSQGITNDKEKHRVRLFHRLLRDNPELSPVYEKFWNMVTVIPDTDEGMLSYVEEALRFSEQIVDNAQRNLE